MYSLEAISKLASFSKLETGWDSYNAVTPSGYAINNTKWVLTRLYRVDRVAPSVVGGIGITVRVPGLKVYIECLNDGRVSVLVEDGVMIETRLTEVDCEWFEKLLVSIDRGSSLATARQFFYR